MAANGITIIGADHIAVPEFDGCGVLVDNASAATEFVDAPVRVSDKGRWPTSISRASSGATNAPQSAEPASQYSYHNLRTYVGTADEHVKSVGYGVGTEEQKHGKSKNIDVVRFDKCSCGIGGDSRYNCRTGG